jgi:hypothetical protein
MEDDSANLSISPTPAEHFAQVVKEILLSMRPGGSLHQGVGQLLMTPPFHPAFVPQVQASKDHVI